MKNTGARWVIGCCLVGFGLQFAPLQAAVPPDKKLAIERKISEELKQALNELVKETDVAKRLGFELPVKEPRLTLSAVQKLSERWIAEMKDDSYLPVKDNDRNYIVKKTGGISATQADVISATLNQNVFMVHIVDAIEAVNFSNIGTGIKIREGYAMTSLDPVALDLFCARYFIKTIPIVEARELKASNDLPSDFLQKVLVAEIEDSNIKVNEGFDSPLFRYHLYEYAVERGIGTLQYYLFGMDSATGNPLYSVEGHLGVVKNGTFSELMTTNMYYSRASVLWDMQKTILSYAKANDELTGSSLSWLEIRNRFPPPSHFTLSLSAPLRSALPKIDLYNARCRNGEARCQLGLEYPGRGGYRSRTGDP